MRLIDADKLYPDCLTKYGRLAISDSQIANAPTVEPESLIKPIAEIKCELTEEEKQRLIELLKKERPTLVKLEPDRKQGEWVVQRLSNGFEDVYCPFCNARPTRSAYGYYLKDNFCHDCGADMRKGSVEMKNIDPIIKAIQENNAKYDERPNIDFSRMSYDLGGGKE